VKRVRWIALGVGVVVVVLGVVLALNVSTSDPNVERGRFTGKNEIAPGFALVSANRTAPAFALETLDGEQLRLSDLAGKTVVVNFWNSWCPPCIEEAPALKEFYERHKNEPDFAMVGIVRDPQRTEDELRDYVAKEGIDWTIALDPKSKAALAYGTTGQPETFVVAPSGRVAGEQFSAVTVDNLELMLRAARGTP
jgi:cytochrome c biogenesis protein CcmG, thiol:disulfide interchange protein DsbE